MLKDKKTNLVKFKPLNHKELRVALERLIRFNSPFDKFERVYKEILIKNSIEPKITAKTFWKYKIPQLNKFFQQIWNESVIKLGVSEKNDYKLNLYLAYEEIKIFSAEEFLKTIQESGQINYKNPRTQETEITFLEYKMAYPLDISGALKAITQKLNASENIQRLIWLDKLVSKHQFDINSPNLNSKLEEIYEHAKQYRQDNSTLNPIELVVLAEGATEETLLPVFSRLAGVDFLKNGIKIISSGGKNPMLKLYAKLSREVNLPILLLLDADGEEEAQTLQSHLRENDEIYVISKGEFEDILPDRLICKAVNIHYRLIGKITPTDLADSDKKAKTLCKLWKEKGFGEFKKAEFASIVAENITRESDLSDELKDIFRLIQSKLI